MKVENDVFPCGYCRQQFRPGPGGPARRSPAGPDRGGVQARRRATPDRTGVCPCCKSYMPDIATRRINTAYVNDELNWQTSCGECFLETVDHYNELWDTYWSEVM